MESKKFLILGGGAVVREFYLPALNWLGLLPYTLVVENSESAIASLVKITPQVRCKRMDFREYLRDYPRKEIFDAVIVALPNCLHTEAVALSLSKGLSVLCEKPLALTEAECYYLGKLAQEKGKIVTVGMVRRLIPAVKSIKQMLKANLIGKLLSIDIEMGPYLWSTESGSNYQTFNGGLLTDMGVHYLDLIQSLIGELVAVSYKDDARGGVEADFEFYLKSLEGVSVRLVLSRLRSLRNTVIFKGEKGELILEKDTFDYCFWRIYSLEDMLIKVSLEKPFYYPHWPKDSLVSCFSQQILNFIEMLEAKMPVDVDAYQAGSIMRLIDWAYNKRKEQNYLPLQERTYKQESFSLRPCLEPARVAITGGTGFIGGHLVERLIELGFSDVNVAVRHYQSCARITRFPIKMPKVDLLDYAQVKEFVKGARFVFHLAYGKENKNASLITIKGTQNIVKASIECAVECVVILSTMYVFGFPDTDILVDESWPYRPFSGEYGLSKANMERWCLKQARKQKQTRIVILNPTCVYGPWAQAYTQLPIKLAQAGQFCWIEEGQGIVNYTFVDNLIDAILLAVSCQEARAQRFIINDGYCCWREFLSPLLGEFAKDLASFNKKELLLMQQKNRSSIKELINHMLDDKELIDIINRHNVLSKIKRVLKFTPLNNYFFKRDLFLLNKSQAFPLKKIPPVWLADLFGPTKTKFSCEKAKKVLGWRPLVSLAQGQDITRNWIQYMGFYNLNKEK